MSVDTYTTPLAVTLRDGEVLITGPDGVAVSLTRQAAIISAQRLLEVAGGEESKEIYQKPLG